MNFDPLNSPQKPETPSNKKLVVVIGFSAGGLEPLEAFFKALPEKLDGTYIVYEHFPENQESHLPEILSRVTPLPVVVAKNGTPLELQHIYVLPASGTFLLKNRHLVESSENHPHAEGMKFDALLESLADQERENAVAIILSGTGSDGARGACAVKQETGLVLVQSPESARFPGLPESVILGGVADFVLPPEDLAKALVKVASHIVHTSPSLPQAEDEDVMEQMRKLTTLLKRNTGLDLGAYKQTSVVRRIERRMGICEVSDFGEYVALLRKNPAECENLAKDMLISVTRFFRDPDAFEKLRETVLPQIIKETDARPLRCWVPGCATGEEVYSLAILIEEAMKEAGVSNQSCKIFATDLDRKALDIACQGLYPSTITNDVPPDLLEKYFVKQGDHYQIVRHIRERIVFAKHNLLKDPPFTRIDIISCRNLLIYLQPPAQQAVLAILHFGLRTGGVLMLGLSETLADMQSHFTPIDSKQHLFVKKGESPLFLSNAMQYSPSHYYPPPPQSLDQNIGQIERSTQRLSETFTNRILSRLNRSCFVLNAKFDVLYSFGTADKHTHIAEGRSSLNLLDLVSKNLAVPLSSALNKVLQDGRPIQYAPIQIADQGESHSVSILVESFRLGKDEDPFLLVFISDTEEGDPIETSNFDLKNSIQRIANLEEELRINKIRLTEVSEELEASTEELQTSNEELQASNEELQSINEEVESVNEELQTVNNECQRKILELSKANEDMDNFIASGDIATIFLDFKLCIRRFTPTAAKKMHLLAHDVGRNISELAHPLLLLGAKAAQRIIDGADIDESIIESGQGQRLLVRATPFTQKDGTRSGSTVSFIQLGMLNSAIASVEAPQTPN
ncbi:MAG: CheR family methyltransferase [bacterium]